MERKYMGGEGREVWGSTLEKGPVGGHAQQDFWTGSAEQNPKYGELKEVREEKEVRECGTRHKQSNNNWRGNRKESKSS